MQNSDAKLCPKGEGSIGCNRAKQTAEETLNTEGWKESVALHAQLQTRSLQLDDSHFQEKHFEKTKLQAQRWLGSKSG